MSCLYYLRIVINLTILSLILLTHFYMSSKSQQTTAHLKQTAILSNLQIIQIIMRTSLVLFLFLFTIAFSHVMILNRIFESPKPLRTQVPFNKNLPFNRLRLLKYMRDLNMLKSQARIWDIKRNSSKKQLQELNKMYNRAFKSESYELLYIVRKILRAKRYRNQLKYQAFDLLNQQSYLKEQAKLLGVEFKPILKFKQKQNKERIANSTKGLNTGTKNQKKEQQATQSAKIELKDKKTGESSLSKKQPSSKKQQEQVQLVGCLQNVDCKGRGDICRNSICIYKEDIKKPSQKSIEVQMVGCLNNNDCRGRGDVCQNSICRYYS